MQHPQQVVEIEIDDLDQFDWEFEIGPDEMKDKTILLVFMVRKTLIEDIENGVPESLKLKQIISQYHVINNVIQSNALQIDSSKLNIIINITNQIVRVYFLLKENIRIYRRFKLNFDSVERVIESTIESYLQKNTNQSVNKIYIASEYFNIEKQIKLHTINNIELSELVFDTSKALLKNDEMNTSLNYFGPLLGIIKKNKFNLYPKMARLEHRYIHWLKRILMIMFACILLVSMTVFGY